MVENGREVNDIAKSLGIGTSLIYYWRNSAIRKMKTAGKAAPLMIDEEKIALRKRVKELEMKRDILEKALVSSPARPYYSVPIHQGAQH